MGYIAKRIEMRKKRYQNLQKLAEQRRAAAAAGGGHPPPGWMEGPDGETAPTVAKSHVTILHTNTHTNTHTDIVFVDFDLGGNRWKCVVSI